MRMRMRPLLLLSCDVWTDRVDESGRYDRALLLFLLPSHDTFWSIDVIAADDIGSRSCVCDVSSFTLVRCRNNRVDV